MNTTTTANQPQMSVRAIILAILLAMLLGAGNAYIGLFAGLTIASAIPAAVARRLVNPLRKSKPRLSRQILMSRLIETMRLGVLRPRQLNFQTRQIHHLRLCFFRTAQLKLTIMTVRGRLIAR